jgi:PEP-CTERM motif
MPSMRIHQRAAFAALTFALAAAPTGRAGVIDDHNPSSFDARYDRFVSGYPVAPVPNTSPSFIGAPYDLSGIGWDSANPTFSITMVSPRHFIGAYHVFQNGDFQINTQVRFFDPVAGVVRSYTIQAVHRPTTTFTNAMGQQQTLPSDVLLGTLSAPIPPSDHITFFPVASGATSQFIGAPMLNHGQNTNYGAGNQTHLGRNNVDDVGLASFDGTVPVNEATVVATYDYNAANPGEFYLVGGDSGGPSFTPINGLLALLSEHYGVSNNTLNPQPGDFSADGFLPAYIDQINAFMAQDTDATHPNGYSLTLTPVPEPASLLLTALAAAGGGYWLRRRRRSVATG